jgi:hypothetical protein
MVVYAQFCLKPGANIRKAAGQVASLAGKNGLRAHGIVWQDKAQFEHDVNALQRFLVDASLSGGTHPAPLGRPV